MLSLSLEALREVCRVGTDMGRDGHPMERECLVQHADVDKQRVCVFSYLEIYEQREENSLHGVGHHLRCQFSVAISFSPIFSNS